MKASITAGGTRVNVPSGAFNPTWFGAVRLPLTVMLPVCDVRRMLPSVPPAVTGPAVKLPRLTNTTSLAADPEKAVTLLAVFESNTLPVVEEAASDEPTIFAVWVTSPAPATVIAPPVIPSIDSVPTESEIATVPDPLTAEKESIELDWVLSRIGDTPSPVTARLVALMNPACESVPAAVIDTGPPAMKPIVSGPAVSFTATAPVPLLAVNTPSLLACVSRVIGAPVPATVSDPASIAPDWLTAPATVTASDPTVDVPRTSGPSLSRKLTVPPGLLTESESALFVGLSRVIGPPLPASLSAVALMNPDWVSGPAAVNDTAPPWMKLTSSAPTVSLIATAPVPLLTATRSIALAWVSSVIGATPLPLMLN